MLAGPNGAGKSTYYRSHLAASPLPFPNAAVLSARTGIHSLEAVRLLDALREDLADRGRSFITETLLFSDPVGAKLGLLERTVSRHCDAVVYVGAEPELLQLRVEPRVGAGGHARKAQRITRHSKFVDGGSRGDE